MSTSFEFDPVERVTAGAVGEPGQRVFYIQAGAGDQLVTLLIEKEQVQALAQSIARLLSIIPEVEDEGRDVPDDELELAEPLLPEWRAGAMALDYDEGRDRIVLVIQEAVEEESEEQPANLRISATRSQVHALALHGAEVVAAGRPRCRICGGPIDPEGHTCPALNGHREIGV